MILTQNTPYLILISVLFITVLYLIWREISKTKFYLDMSKRMDSIETSYNNLVKQVGQQTNNMCNELREEIHSLMNGSSAIEQPHPTSPNHSEHSDTDDDVDDDDDVEPVIPPKVEPTVPTETPSEHKDDDDDDFHVSESELNNLDDDNVPVLNDLNDLTEMNDLNIEDIDVDLDDDLDDDLDEIEGDHDVVVEEKHEEVETENKTAQELENMSLTKLKEFAQKKGVGSRGKKSEIIQRLLKK